MWGTGNKGGFSYVELGSRRGILVDIFGNMFTDYMYREAPGTSTLKTRPSAGVLRVASVPALHA